MASASPSPLASSVEKTNGAKLSRLLIDGGTTVLRNIFNGHHPPASLPAAFHANYSTLNHLLKRRILHRPQWDLLFPPSGIPPDSQTFDITLLFLLLSNICGLSPPHSGWHSNPPPSDSSLEANLARIKFYRNQLYGHVSTTGVADPTFSTLWQEISAVLVALGLQQAEIDRLQAERCGEQEIIDALLEWADTEEDIKSQLKDMRDMQAKVLHAVEGLKGERKGLRRDEILTKLAKVDPSSDISHHAGKYVEGTRLSVFAEIERWLEDRSSPNRVIVISGNAGMGKSVISAVLCQKMLKAGRLSGSHFCRHNKARRRNPKVLLQSLARQLSDSLPEYEKALVKNLSGNLGVEINEMEVEELFELLFGEPLLDVEDPGSIHLMIIDGLDESEYKGRNELLNVIANFFKTLPHWIRFFVTTRPEMNISEKLQELNPIQLKPNDQENLMDIRLCFKEQLEHFLQSDCEDTILEKLVGKSEGVMLFTYYLIEFINKNALRMSAEELINSDLPSDISSVYQNYFKRLKTELQEEVGITEVQFYDFLNALVAAREPLPIDFACKLFLSKEWSSADEQKVRDAMDCISALLPIEGECINFFHKSVKDWLIEKSTSRQKKFTVNERECQRVIAKLCTDELDTLKRKGIPRSGLNQTSRYALQHGVQHILEMEENARPHCLDDIVKNYVLDIELMYAKLSVKSTAATEDILCVQENEDLNVLSQDYRRALETLLLLLRRHVSTLSQVPHAIFQTLLNEGGPELSAEALSLLDTKYADLPYMEYLRKKEEGEAEAVLMRFYVPDSVACFDVSPNLHYLVCECRDGTIHMWSLRTAQLLWKHAVQVPKNYEWDHDEDEGADFEAYRKEELSDASFFCRSVVFHPTLNLILPGILRQAYTLAGDLKPLFLTSKCRFNLCSISGDKTTMLTDCPNRKKFVTQWSLKDGTEITRFSHERDILSFAWSPSGRLMAIADSAHCIYLINIHDRLKTMIWADTRGNCSMLKLAPDCRFLFSFCFDRTWDHLIMCLDIERDTESIYNFNRIPMTRLSQYALAFETCNESGFLSGDPFWYPLARSSFCFPTFALVLNKELIIRAHPVSNVIEMFRLNDARRGRGESGDEAEQGTDLGDLTEQRAENKDLTEQKAEFAGQAEEKKLVDLDDLLEIDDMQGRKAENGVLSGQRAEVVDPLEQRAELDLSEDAERQGPLLEDIEESGVIEDDYFMGEKIVGKVYFSVDGDSLYVVMGTKIQGINLRTGGIFTKRFKGRNARFLFNLHLVPVKRGVLFKRDFESLELWNSELSVCIQRWTAFCATNVVPLSEELVAWELRFFLAKEQKVTVLDTTSEKIVSIIGNFDGTFLACNSKCEVLTYTYGDSLQLRCENRVLWETSIHPDLQDQNVPVIFSPTEEYFIISGKTDSCVFEVVSGKVISQLKNTSVDSVKFISNEDYIAGVDVLSERYFLRLYNVKSGDLLSEIVEERGVVSFAACPCKRLVAVGLRDSEDYFEIIQVKLPGDNEKKNDKRSVETTITWRQKKNNDDNGILIFYYPTTIRRV